MGDANGDAPLGKWAQRKEARRNMYATSTEQVRVHRRGLGASSASSAVAMCQKCLRPGHWTYECKNEAVYVQRPSRSQQLRNPKLRQPFNKDKPPELQDEEEEKKKKAEKSKKLKRKDKHRAKTKKKAKTSSRSRRKRRPSISSSGSSDSSSSESSSSDSDSDSDSSSDSSSSSSESSSGSDSDSSSDSNSSSSSSGSDRNSHRRHSSKRQRRD
ncbi:Zinc finger CCHC domain-containing protein 10 [Phytophthora pseudosyringae]|uniref:Zinc finger CCHC domain-containing protein 10 n=1 Tax=Phytophthora pseudosyringae TaxID=221518 RepID=A0A8T1VR93_9STRA|nr:Zinc finger CCHC domain-containing protein 10 [Phytophthora pseudosyringae]